MTIDLRVHGSPSQCWDAAGSLRHLKEALIDASIDVRRGVETSSEGWDGPAGEAFRVSSKGLQDDLEGFGTEIGQAATGLDTFAGKLQGVRNSMEQARSMALAGGLPVSTEAVGVPVEPAVELEPAAARAHESKVA